MSPIGGIEGENNPCYLCKGTGLIDEEFHYACMGTGYRGGLQLAIFLKQLREDSLEKLDAIQSDITAIKAKTDNMPADLVNVLQDIHDHVE